jgi:hypothetical protein
MKHTGIPLLKVSQMLCLCIIILTGMIGVQHRAFAASGDANVLFILDGSGSMWGRMKETGKEVEKIVIAKDTMSDLVQDLPKSFTLGLMVYGHRRKGDCDDIELLSPLGQSDPATIIQQIQSIKPKGKTPITKSIQLAAQQLEEIEEETTIVLVSDGKETCEGDPCEYVRTLKDMGIDFTMHVVGFDVNEEERKQLACIADAGGGRYFSAQNAMQLKEAFEEVKAEVVKKVEPSLDLSRGLVAYYPFNGNANDESGNGNHGVIRRANLTKDRLGNDNSAYSFSGHFESYMHSTVNILPQGNSERTLCVWVKSVDGVKDGNSDHIVNWGTATTGNAFGLMLFINNHWWGYGHWYHDTDSGIRADTNWHFLCCVYDNERMKVYVDDNLAASRDITLNTRGTDLYIGTRPDLDRRNTFDGIIDDIRIYNRALSESEIQALYREGGRTAKIVKKVEPQEESKPSGIYTDDFTSGIDERYWKIETNQNLFTVDDTNHEIRFSKGHGGRYDDYQYICLRFLREVRGDFDVQIDFHSAGIDRSDAVGRDGNQISLVVKSADRSFVACRTDELHYAAGHNVHVWDSFFPTRWSGTKATSATSGTLRITREGRLVTAYFNNAPIYTQHNYNDSPVTRLAFYLANFRTKDATSVTFDNFYLSCDEMVPLK